MKYCVYKHTSPSGKVYIGITRQNPLKRWCNGNGYSNNPHFYRAIQKYGWDNIKHEILFDNLSKHDACKIEISLIKKHKSNNPAFGYNHSTGGENAGEGVEKSEETRRKISNALLGRKLTPEHIEKSAIAHTGLKRNEETRRKMSESAKIRGVSEKTREKTRAQVICVQTGMIFPSINDASRKTGIIRTAISNCCCGRAKTAGGYVWRYL